MFEPLVLLILVCWKTMKRNYLGFILLITARNAVFNHVVRISYSTFYCDISLSGTIMAASSTSNAISIVNNKRPLNFDLGSIMEYLPSVLAADGNLDHSALKNENLLLKDYFVHSIRMYKQYVKRTISAKCHPQMKKSTTYQVTSLIDFYQFQEEVLFLLF